MANASQFEEKPQYHAQQEEKPQGTATQEMQRPENQPGEAQEEQGSREPTRAGPTERKRGLRGTAAMDAQTRREVARKGGLAVSRNKTHMAEIGRKGGQTVSKNREHMSRIGRKGGAASRSHRG